jgi:hypothetical protein
MALCVFFGVQSTSSEPKPFAINARMYINRVSMISRRLCGASRNKQAKMKVIQCGVSFVSQNKYSCHLHSYCVLIYIRDSSKGIGGKRRLLFDMAAKNSRPLTVCEEKSKK